MLLVLDDIGIQFLTDIDVLELPIGSHFDPLPEDIRGDEQGENAYVKLSPCRLKFGKVFCEFPSTERVDDDHWLVTKVEKPVDEGRGEGKNAYVFRLVGPVDGNDHASQRVDFQSDTFLKMCGKKLRSLGLP